MNTYQEDIYTYRASKERLNHDVILAEKRSCLYKRCSIPTSYGYMDMDLYYPTTTNKTQFPVYFNLHGGGFVLGYPQQDGEGCRFLSDHANCIVVNVDYFLAPENKFPIPVLSLYEALYSLLNHASEYHMDPNHIAIGGHSAGGNLASGVIQKASQENKLQFSGLIMDYSPTDLTLSCQQKKLKTIDNRMIQYMNWYFQSENDRTHPFASPLYSDFTAFPKCLILSAQLDPLRYEEETFTRKLKENNIDVTYTCYKDCKHGFTHKLFDYHEEQADRAWKQMSSFLQDCFY